LFYELEELGLGGGGVTDEQDVDVPAEDGLVGQVFAGAAEQHAGDGLLDLIVAIYTWGDGSVYFVH
jgi:hypothetical protein